jgi:hypothetical protein
MIARQTGEWIVFFHQLQTEGLYQALLVPDRIVFLFVFTPILRRELRIYAETYNEHRIRPQSERANYQPGVPNELYFNNSKRLGFVPDETLLTGLEEALNDVGEFINEYRKIYKQ